MQSRASTKDKIKHKKISFELKWRSFEKPSQMKINKWWRKGEEGGVGRGGTGGSGGQQELWDTTKQTNYFVCGTPHYWVAEREEKGKENTCLWNNSLKLYKSQEKHDHSGSESSKNLS